MTPWLAPWAKRWRPLRGRRKSDFQLSRRAPTVELVLLSIRSSYELILLIPIPVVRSCTHQGCASAWRVYKCGVFAYLAPGRTGVIPLSETGIAKEADVRRVFAVGADVEVIVLEVDPAGRRIRLSAKAVMDAREAAEVREWTARNAPPASGSGILADKLLSALKPQK